MITKETLDLLNVVQGLVNQISKKWPDGEALVCLRASLGLEYVHGVVWLDWKCEQILFEDVPIQEAIERLEKILRGEYL